MSQLLKIREVATRLRVSDSTVRRLLKAGTLHGVAVGGSYRIPAEDLDRYLSDNQTTSPIGGGK